MYKNTSTNWPLTYGSFGSCISRGTNSDDEGFFDDVVSDARVFDRGRKGEEDCEGEAGGGEVGDAPENAGWDGERVAEASEAAECDRDFIGTIKLCRLWFEAWGESGERGLVSSSGGISSAAGIGSPLPTATNWCSVHSSLKSSSPLQNGAIRRSI